MSPTTPPMLLLLMLMLMSCQGVTGQNVACMTLRCFSQMTKCFSDHDCRTAVSCLGGCGSNQSCALPCLATYENDLLDSFLYCVVTQHHCITLPAPTPPVVCSPPTEKPLNNFTLSMFAGDWYVILGLNRNYDCFACQMTTYAAVPDTHNFTMTEKYLAPTLNQSLRVRVANMSGEVKDIQHGGIVTFSGLENGLIRAEQWRIMVYNKDAGYAVIYYCGTTGSWKYEGTLVYSRTHSVSPMTMTSLRTDMEKAGFNVKDFCSPRTHSCVYT